MEELGVTWFFWGGASRGRWQLSLLVLCCVWRRRRLVRALVKKRRACCCSAKLWKWRVVARARRFCRPFHRPNTRVCSHRERAAGEARCGPLEARAWPAGTQLQRQPSGQTRFLDINDEFSVRRAGGGGAGRVYERPATPLRLSAQSAASEVRPGNTLDPSPQPHAPHPPRLNLTQQPPPGTRTQTAPAGRTARRP